MVLIMAPTAGLSVARGSILFNINYSTLKTETIKCNFYYRGNSQFNPENFLIELEHSFLQSFILNDQEYSINSRFQEFYRIFLQY